MRALFVLAIPIFALWLGTKWEEISSRTQDVTVVFKDEKKETGILSRAWSGAYVLYRADGTSIHFRDFLMIEIPAKPIVENSSVFLGSWRLFLSLIVGVALALSLSLRRSVSPVSG